MYECKNGRMGKNKRQMEEKKEEEEREGSSRTR